MSDYDIDILTWSEQQAELLRLHAAGKPSNQRPDWDNIIDELLDVGLSAVRACRSLLLQALLHRLKVLAWPTSTTVPHWTSEATVALASMAGEYVPSMRSRIDLERIYGKARKALPSTVDGVLPLPVPETCPFTLEELLRDGE